MFYSADTGAYFCTLDTISYKPDTAKVNLRVIDGIKPNLTQVIKSTLWTRVESVPIKSNVHDIVNSINILEVCDITRYKITALIITV